MKDYLRKVRAHHKAGDADRIGVTSTTLNEISVKSVGEQVIVQAVANTAAVDLADEVLIPSGANPEIFKAYKSILWNHDDNVPVGKLIDCNLVKGGDAWFVRFGISQATEFTRGVGAMLREGVINGTSVGFRRTSQSPPSKEEIAKYGPHRMTVREWEWLELSVVPLPCNPEALIQSAKSGLVTPQTAIDLGAPKEAFAWGGKKLTFKRNTPTLSFRGGA